MCAVCGIKAPLYRAQIHHRSEQSCSVLLCYKHDLELFKKGQYWFLKHYNLDVKKLPRKSEAPVAAEAPEAS